MDSWATPEQARRVREIWQSPQLARSARALTEVGIEPYLVGGVVRDLLLDRENKDVDLIVDCTPRKLFRLQRRLARLTEATTVPLDPARGTLRLCFSATEEIDLVALQGKDLLQDLARRDLRLNAMAVDREGRLADPTGGRDDLKERRLHAVSAENLAEDPLRVLRCVRFAAQLGFALDPSTLLAAREAAPGLARVAGERITAELAKFFPAASADNLALLWDIDLYRNLDIQLPEQWETARVLLAELSQRGGLTLEIGLAVFFGPNLEPGSLESLVQRLKLSRKTGRYLEHWARGVRFCRAGRLELRDIFQLSREADAAFRDLARAANCPSFPMHLESSSREALLREAEGRGELRWEPMPWTGHDVSEAAGRSTGPWLGDAMRKLEEAWALREIDSVEEMTALTRSLPEIRTP